jgi:hypothetical protein
MVDLNKKTRSKPLIIGNNIVGEKAAAESSAIIQIDDANGGFLTARLTTEQRDAIADPTNGLLIWNVDASALEVYTDGIWVQPGAGGGGEGFVTSDPSGIEGAFAITNIVGLSQAAYDALPSPDPETAYFTI